MLNLRGWLPLIGPDGLEEICVSPFEAYSETSNTGEQLYDFYFVHMLLNQHIKGTDFFNSIQIFRSENLINDLFMKDISLRVSLFINPGIILDKEIKGFRGIVATFESKNLEVLYFAIVRSLTKTFLCVKNIVVHTRINLRVQN